MITRAFLFPETTFLSTRWWHRLAKVIFWAWLIVVLVWLINATLLDPYSGCVTFKARLELASDSVSNLNCGNNAFEYLQSHLTAAGAAFFAILTYLALLLPGLLYRLGLYISQGNAWKDAAGEA